MTSPEFVKLKSTEAQGIVLDWMVAKALNPENPQHGWDSGKGKPAWLPYSTDGGLAMKVIDDACIELLVSNRHENMREAIFPGRGEDAPTAFGPNSAIAGMRAFVLGTLGAEIEVPMEIIEQAGEAAKLA